MRLSRYSCASGGVNEIRPLAFRRNPIEIVATWTTTSTPFDRTFPPYARGVAHFDGPGGSQTPDAVADAIAGTLTSSISNRGTVTASERRADAVVTPRPRGDG